MEIVIIELLNDIKSLISEKKTNGWISINEALEYCNLSKSTIHRAIQKGELKASKRTGKLLFKRTDIDKWLRG